jgi:hypothetical protein
VVQRLRLATAIGEEGRGLTEYEIRALLERTGTNTWTLGSSIDGATLGNFQFTRMFPRRMIETTQASVKDAKAQAVDFLRQRAAGFLKIPEVRLTIRSTAWIDDSD